MRHWEGPHAINSVKDRCMKTSLEKSRLCFQERRAADTHAQLPIYPVGWRETEPQCARLSLSPLYTSRQCQPDTHSRGGRRENRKERSPWTLGSCCEPWLCRGIKPELHLPSLSPANWVSHDPVIPTFPDPPKFPPGHLLMSFKHTA